jgi:hypothetical protein
MTDLANLALFLTGEGTVRLIAAYGNFFLLVLVLYLIYLILKFIHFE